MRLSPFFAFWNSNHPFPLLCRFPSPKERSDEVPETEVEGMGKGFVI